MAAATLPSLWQRHVADSLQLRALAPAGVRTWTDLGSGGGFPGLVVALQLVAEPAAGAHVHLVESTAKKAAFLRAAIRELGLPATVHAMRIEAADAALATADVVSARALASLDALFGMVAGRIPPHSVCLFPKGRAYPQEIVDARRRWRFTVTEHPSRTEDGAAVLEVRDIEARPNEA